MYFILTCMGVFSGCVAMDHACASAQGQKRERNALESESQTVVSFHVGAETQTPRHFGRAARAVSTKLSLQSIISTCLLSGAIVFEVCLTF